MVRELGYGVDGDDVKALQTLLFELGYTEVGTPDGRFGDLTTASLFRFQSETGLGVTGTVDDATRAAVIATATAYGLAHLGTPLLDDAYAYAHGQAPHHAGASDQVHAHPAAGGSPVPDDAPRSPDGHYWWDGAAWQLLHPDGAGAGDTHGGAHRDRAGYVELMQGFTDLAVAAIQHEGRTLDTVRFGAHLSSAHHGLLEHVRRTLIDAQADEASRRRAVHDWPALESQLQAAAGEARAAGVSEESVLLFTENLAAVGEGYVHVKHEGAAHVESGADYADLVKGISDLLHVVDRAPWDRTSGVVPTDVDRTNAAQQAALHGIAFGGHVTPAHAELLAHLRTAFVLARTPGSARAALAQWQSVQTALHHALTRAVELGVLSGGEWIPQMIAELDEKLFHQGVIAEAEHAAEQAHGRLDDPGLPLQIERLQEAAEGFAEVEQLIDKSKELTSEYALSVFLDKGGVDPTLAHAIFEIAKNPHEVYEKLEEFKKQGTIEKSITVAVMADKMLTVRNGVMEVAFETIHSFAEKQAKDAAARGLTELAEHWEGTKSWAMKNIDALDKVKKAGTVITIAVGAIKVIDAIRRGEWAEAVKEAASTGLGLAVGAAAGTAGTVVLGGVTLMVAAELEGIRGAAAMISFARESNEKEALTDFLDVCDTARDIEAQSLVTHVELLKDPANAGERGRITAKLDDDARYWRSHLRRLSELYAGDRENTIGGQPKLKEHLGADARQVLSAPDEGGQLSGPPSWENMARQIHAVFAGANRMTQYFVQEHTKA